MGWFILGVGLTFLFFVFCTWLHNMCAASQHVDDLDAMANDLHASGTSWARLIQEAEECITILEGRGPHWQPGLEAAKHNLIYMKIKQDEESNL